MGLLKKISSEWQPSEAPDLKIGETVEITDYTRLVRSGAAVLVDEDGVEQPLPGQVFACPICYKGLDSLLSFVAHVDTHKRVDSTELSEKEDSEEVLGKPVEVVTKTVKK